MQEQNSNTPVQPSMSLSPPIKLWTPGFIAGVTFLLGFPAGIVIASINWMRMNLKNKAILFLVCGIAWVVPLTFIGLFLPDNTGTGLSLLGNIGVLYILYKQMSADIANFQSSNNTVGNASKSEGCLIGLLVMGLYLVLALGTGIFVVGILMILGVPIPE